MERKKLRWAKMGKVEGFIKPDTDGKFSAGVGKGSRFYVLCLAVQDSSLGDLVTHSRTH